MPKIISSRRISSSSFETEVRSVLAIIYEEEVTKTELLTVWKGRFWEKRVTTNYVIKIKEIYREFNRLVAEGIIIYEPRQKLKIGKVTEIF